MIKRLFALAICVLIPFSLLSSPALAQEKMASSKPPQAAFDKLVDEYFDFHFQFHPTEGTQAGLHQYDGKLEDFSRAGMDAEIAGLQQFQKEIRFDLNQGTIPGIGGRPGDSYFFHSGSAARTADHPDVEERSRCLYLRS